MAVIQEAYVQGISTRAVDDLVHAMGSTGASKSEVSRLCKEIEKRFQAFLNRPLEPSGTLTLLRSSVPSRTRYPKVIAVCGRPSTAGPR